MSLSKIKSFGICVIIPSLLASIFFCFFASDRYVSGAGFTIRKINYSPQSDLIGSVTGLPSGSSSISDSYIIVKFLNSRDMLERISKNFNLSEIYGRSSIDFISRMRSGLKIEQVLSYWNKRTDSDYDPTSGIINFEVTTFDPVSSFEIAKFIHREVEMLTNILSEKAKSDSLKFANEEVSIAEDKLLNARLDIRHFRSDNNAVDISALSSAQLELLSDLEKQLSNILSRTEVLRGTLDYDAPSIKALEAKSKAIELQILSKSGGLKITGRDEKLSSLLSQQEVLESKKEFAESLYLSALKSLDNARKDTAKNQKYLATFSFPYLPEHPAFPRPLLHSFYFMAALSLLWGIFGLIYYSVLDQMQSGWSDPDDLIESRFKSKLIKLFRNPYLFFRDSKFIPLRLFKHFFKNSSS